MVRQIILAGACFIFLGCTASDYTRLTRAALSKDPSSALKVLGTAKGIQYASNPARLEKDLKHIEGNIAAVFEGLAKAVGAQWGVKNIKESSKTQTVKYLQGYQSRALIDFDKGVIRVESIAQEEVQKHLEEAIITTLLLPDDPRQVDLFSSQKVTLGDTPYLFKEVVDAQGKPIRWEWRASRYAKVLIKNGLRKESIEKDGKTLQLYSVSFPMVKDHASVRVAKFKPLVKEYAARYKLSENLVYAIIKTESNFNQFAISRTGAVGLMQVMPNTAGTDAYEYLKGKQWKPSREYLFDPQNNIELGSVYLHIIRSKYLAGLSHEISQEYCTISAYNGGSGTVLRTFDEDRERAKAKINALSPMSVYEALTTQVPYEETREYLKKVLTHKKLFVQL